MDIKEEFDLEKLLIIKKELLESFGKISSINNNEEYERRSFEYYNNLNDLNKNKVYDQYIKSSLYALKAGYKFGVDDISMGFMEIEGRMPLILNEERYLIKNIQKKHGYLIKNSIEKEIMMSIFIFFYKKCMKEKGDRYIKIDLEPLPHLEKLEKENVIKGIINTAKNKQIA